MLPQCPGRGSLHGKPHVEEPEALARTNDALSSQDYAQAIAAALRAELGGSHRATKVTMRWSGAGERTVKHWLSGTSGPGGPNLINLLRHSDSVLATVLVLSGRQQHLAIHRLSAAHAILADALHALEAALQTPGTRDPKSPTQVSKRCVQIDIDT